MKSKPPKCCHPNCENCPYADCKWDEITHEDMKYIETEDSTIKNNLIENDDSLTYKQKWRLKNIERDRANKHRHYIEHIEQYKDRHNKYYAEHKEEVLKKETDYYKAHREKVNAYNRERMRKYREENRELVNQKQREYRARKKAEKELMNNG